MRSKKDSAVVAAEVVAVSGTTVEALVSESVAARTKIVSDLNAMRVGLLATLASTAAQLAAVDTERRGHNLEDFDAPDLSAIDYLYETEETPVRKTRQTRKAGTRGPRGPSGQKTMPLHIAILTHMDGFEFGSEFYIEDLVEGVQSEDIGYQFTGTTPHGTIVSQRTTALVNDGLIERPSRGLYTLTKAGSDAVAAYVAEQAAAAE